MPPSCHHRKLNGPARHEVAPSEWSVAERPLPSEYPDAGPHRRRTPWQRGSGSTTGEAQGAPTITRPQARGRPDGLTTVNARGGSVISACRNDGYVDGSRRLHARVRGVVSGLDGTNGTPFPGAPEDTTTPEYRVNPPRSHLIGAKRGNPARVRCRQHGTNHYGHANGTGRSPARATQSSGGTGWAKKQTPAAERQGEPITRRIGRWSPTRKRG